jgi:hypothetical protein
MVYSWSKFLGLARALSANLIGQHIEGIWHTSIVAYEKEWFYGQGIFETAPVRQM